MSTKTGFRAQLAGGLSLRVVALIAGVLLLQLAFIASYVGAFHAPAAHRIDVGVVAPAAQASAVRDQLNAAAGEPVAARVIDSAETATRQIIAGDLVAALVVAPDSTQDTLLVATARGAALEQAVEQIAAAAATQQGRTFRTQDLVALQDGDARGMSGFYLVIGWLVGGYLVAALLGVASGPRPASVPAALVRLGAMAPYALLSGLGGALVVDQGLGALTGHFWAIAGVGTLVVLASSAVTMAFQALAGTLGVGLTVLVFVVLGNPSAGGAYQYELLPTLWRTIGSWMPNGAGTTALRHLVYFDGAHLGGPLAVIVVWILAGAALTLAATAYATRSGRVAEDPLAPETV